jgi:hypothetical protein
MESGEDRGRKDFNYAFGVQGLCGLIAIAMMLFS